MEAIIACFLLLSAFLVVINLFNSSLNYTSRIESQQLAAQLGERQLERMRNWSESLNGSQYNYDNPGLAATYNGNVSAISDFPDFTCSTHVVSQGLYSGCTETELPLSDPAIYNPPLVVPRYLPGQASKVVVKISWAGGQKSLQLASIFSEPALTFSQTANPITIAPAVDPGPVGHNVSVVFQASAVDSNNNAIGGLLYNWALVPVNGTATLTQARDGSVAVLTNQIYGPPYVAPEYLGTPAFTGGQCMLQVTATYHGQLVTQNTTAVTLAP